MRSFNDLPKLSVKPRFKFIRHILLGVSFLLVLGAGYVLGQSTANGREKLNLSQFWQAYDIIDRRFVGSIDSTKATEGAISGLVESLGDPFSSFLAAQAKKDLDSELSGQFEGIGAELTLKNNLITVIAPLSSSPAASAGLKAKDVIIKIDDSSTESMTLDEAVSKIRGPKNTTVKLTVARERQDALIELTITRANILVKSVKTKTLSDNIVYIEITQFGDDTVDLFKSAVAEIAKQNPRAIILDLRNNPGGYLDDVAPVVGQFIAPSVVVKERYKDGRIDEIRSGEVPSLPSTPLYVLINGGSASAAEIVAGALQDYGRAKLIGQKSFGKGSVQEIMPMKNGAALRLTIAEWLTPKDRQINKKGIEPDIVVEGDKTADSDPVLAKAVELAGK
ncbi:MAG: S41 family peptidase [Patescibacteria group bacterium]|mgnify:CR=1 FL=1